MTDPAAKLLPYRSYINEQKASLAASIRQLEKEGRQDEANLAKIRLNIVGVFETLLSADQAYCKGDQEAFFKRYEGRFTSIPASWQANLEKARTHGDASAQLIEEVKLQTANELHDVFLHGSENA